MIYRDLNLQQQAVVESDENIYLTACPGSGKTRTLVAKIAYELVRNPNSNTKILAVTFTNRAADEILFRLSKLNLDTSRVWAGTIHRFCLEWILRPFADKVPLLKKGITILENNEQDRILNDLKRIYNLNSNINTSLGRDGLPIEKNSLPRKASLQYYEILEERKVIDFNLMLYLSTSFLKDYPHVSTSLSNMIQFICVDEFQDTQDLQYAVLSGMLKNTNITNSQIIFVGDPDQAIYTSLGGVVKTKEELEEEFACSFIRMKLDGNYRTSQRIIDYYQHFRKSNFPIQSLDKYKDELGCLTYYRNITKYNVAQSVYDLVSFHLKSGIDHKEICILAPQWWMLQEIRKKLKVIDPELSINFPSVFHTRDRENIFYKITRLIFIPPSFENQFYRKSMAEKIIFDMELIFGIPIFDYDKPYLHFLRAINSTTVVDSNTIQYLMKYFDKLFTRLSFDRYHIDVLSEYRKNFFDKLQENLCHEHNASLKETSEFMKIFGSKKGILMHTAIGVKGEEFEVVIAFGLLEGYVPHWDYVINKKDQAELESQKILYVICSRAKRFLHLFSEAGHETRNGSPYKLTPVLCKYNYTYDIH